MVQAFSSIVMISVSLVELCLQYWKQRQKSLSLYWQFYVLSDDAHINRHTFDLCQNRHFIMSIC